MLKKKLFIRDRFYKKAGFWRAAVNILLLLVFLLSFRGEINSIFDFINAVRNGIEPDYTGADIILSAVKVVYNFIITSVLFFIWVLFISQFVLPVRSNKERRLVFQRLVRYMVGLHGPAVFIENGLAIADENEMDNTRPGVAFVDLCSAIALESQWGHVDKGNSLFSRFRRSHVYHLIEKIIRIILGNLFNLIRKLLGRQIDQRPLVRIAGPGIVFTHMHEKIRHIADLRRQMRRSDVRVITRDGIETQVPVSVIFSLGDKPEILYVTYDWDVTKGGWEEEARFNNIRVVKKNDAGNKIEQIIDDLDDADKREIHYYVTTHDPSGRDHEEELAGYDYPPYHFDEDRVFAALYSHALETVDGTPMNWAELPIHLASEELRDLIAEEDYDTLYQVKNPAVFPLYQRILPEFRSFMRNQGVLAYQFVLRRDGSPLKKGDLWVKRDLVFYPLQDLNNSKVLRDRGIRVLRSSFSELTPRHAGVREQQVEQWRSGWESERQEIASRAELEAANIVALARRTAYREIISSLEIAYTGLSAPKDALALRLFQTIEQALLDPRTQELLPAERLSLLLELRNYFKPTPGNKPKPAPGGRSTR